MIAQAPSDSYQAPQSGKSALHTFGDEEEVKISDILKGKVTLQVVHTPGHDQDHCCFLFKEEGRLFTGDHVLGQGTSVFNDLGDYMRSLKKCSDLLDTEAKSSGTGDKEVLLYPAHGPTIENGKAMLKQYYAHRLERENQVLDLLGKAPPTSGETKAWTINQITAKLYASYPEMVWPQAARGLFRHLHKLGTPDSDAQKTTGGTGQRVKCLNTSDGLAPPVPSHTDLLERWEEVLEYNWTLLDNKATSQTGKL
jgi:endoribonuclease LACTB2